MSESSAPQWCRDWEPHWEEAPSRVYAPAVVLPFTFTFLVPRPSVPALFTSAAEPEVMDSTWVKFRVVSGTAVIVLASTTVLVEEVVTLIWHWQFTGCAASPRSRTASSAGTSETFTSNDAIRAVLK